MFVQPCFISFQPHLILSCLALPYQRACVYGVECAHRFCHVFCTYRDFCTPAAFFKGYGRKCKNTKGRVLGGTFSSCIVYTFCFLVPKLMSKMRAHSSIGLVRNN
ncbi:hypothetical protein BKA83DRAFT_4293805 [Pisolithus microcarpus]|nr:hypothetical protein BKA83DRAFT_4293805 [Pisolithus microcarpus]